MPFTRNSLQTIIDRIVADFKTRIVGANSLLRRSALGVIARVNAGAFHLLYEYLDFQARQLFVTTADEAGLETHGAEYGIPRKTAAYSVGSGVATGINGTVIPADSELVSPNDHIYIIDTEVTIAGGVATVDLTSQVAGADSNDDPGVLLAFISPIVGVDTDITIDSDGISGGTDEETDDSYRDRILTRKRRSPHGGAEFDYADWSLEISGVTRAWAFPQYQGAGTIGVAFVRDDDTDIIPNLTQREIVRSYIVEHEDPGTGLNVGIPVTAEPGLFIIELSLFAVSFEISIYPNTAAVRSAIEDNLVDLIAREGGPGNTLYLSQIDEAISLATGEERHDLIAPVADVSGAVNQVHILGTLTFGDY